MNITGPSWISGKGYFFKQLVNVEMFIAQLGFCCVYQVFMSENIADVSGCLFFQLIFLHFILVFHQEYCDKIKHWCMDAHSAYPTSIALFHSSAQSSCAFFAGSKCCLHFRSHNCCLLFLDKGSTYKNRSKKVWEY